MAAGGAAVILGSATSAGTYVVEYWLCKKQLDKANKFITADKMKVEKYQSISKSLRHFVHNIILMILIVYHLFRLS